MPVGNEDNWDTASNRAAQHGVAGAGRLEGEDPDYVALAREAYNHAWTWMETSLRPQWDRNYKAFNNRHPNGSKYRTKDYQHRSKLFRPKTRSSIRKSEAACAQAFFATMDLLTIEPTDQGDQMQAASAKILKELVGLRLDTKPIRWFLTVLGAWQSTRIVGVATSKQYWCHEEPPTQLIQRFDEFSGEPTFDGEGNPVFDEVPGRGQTKDEPRIDLRAPENLLIDAGANWLDPINTSPFVIDRIPMYVGDIKERISRPQSRTGSPSWLELDDGQISQATTMEYNSTSQARRDNRQDPTNKRSSIKDHDIAWVHENFMRVGGEELNWYTIGTSGLLSVPQPLEMSYLHGERPFVMGYSIVEAHKPFPAGSTELSQDLQTEANELTNQRIDVGRFAINPRQYAKTGGSVDIDALSRSWPGKVIGVEHPTGPDADVTIEKGPEPGAWSFNETDRINVDFDEIAGNFSPGSVQSNRSLNETVGGMKMLTHDSDTIKDYDLRVFTETWVEPVLRQLVSLEQAYETDATLLAVAGRNAKLHQKFGIDQITDELLQSQLTTKVNVGIGSTDPGQRMERFGAGLRSLKELVGDDALRYINIREVMEETWGILGYRDGERFHMWPDGEDSAVAQLQQIIGEMQKMLEESQSDAKVKMAIEHLKSQSSLAETSLDNKNLLIREMIKQQGDEKAQKLDIYTDAVNRSQDRGNARLEAQRGRAHETRQGESARAHESEESKAARASGNGSSPSAPTANGASGGNGADSTAAALSAMARAITQLAEAQAAPKRLLRDAQGRPIGVAAMNGRGA